MKRFVLILLAALLCLPALPALAEDTPYRITMIANFGSTSNTEESEADRIFFENLGDRFDMEIEIQIPPAPTYNESVQVMFASGDYPDVVQFDENTDKVFVDAVRGGLILPLNDYLESCPNLIQYSYDVSWDAMKVLGDDGIYGVPRTSIARADGYGFRRDWLEKLGIDVKDGEYITLEQLEEIARVFTFGDPDGDGRDNTYGISVQNTDGNLTPQFPWTFGLNGWQEYDGEYMNLVYSRDHDNYKRALQWTHDRWEEGVIDPDWPTLATGDAYNERFRIGITGMKIFFPGHLTDFIKVTQAIDPDFDLVFVPGIVESEESGSYFGGAYTNGFWGLWSVTAAAEQPERIMAMFDYLLSDEGWTTTMYGPEGVTWTTDENGDKVALDAYATYHWGKATLRRNNDPAFFVSLAEDSASRERIERLIGLCIDQCRFPLDGGFRPSVCDDPIYIDYQKYMAAEVTKIIMGERPVDDWDEILDGWYAAGGEQYVAEMQAFIAAKQKKE
ncbi:MAG: extracellular solute-binding protein [Clostridia bacterium]|nr:extracellular solute-binding protein [Clostridia bacterium]